MADPWAGYTDKGPQAPQSEADPWIGWRDAGPNAPPDEKALTFAERRAAEFDPREGRTIDAFDPASYRPTAPLSPTKVREVPEPDRSTQSIPEMMRNVSQRARNTAFGQGPGSVAGIPGAALPTALEGASVVGLTSLASKVAQGAAAATKQLPATALAATAGYVASHFGDQPEWLKEFVHNLLLHVQLSAGGKK